MVDFTFRPATEADVPSRGSRYHWAPQVVALVDALQSGPQVITVDSVVQERRIRNALGNWGKASKGLPLVSVRKTASGDLLVSLREPEDAP